MGAEDAISAVAPAGRTATIRAEGGRENTMREALRAFLVASSVLVQLLVVTPAGAEMIPTPRPRPEEREAALQGAAVRLPADADGLRGLPTAELLLLANAPEAFLHAASDAAAALVVIVCVVLFVTTIIVVVIISRIERHMRHIHGHSQRDAEPVPVTSERASKQAARPLQCRESR
jgi:hypothetical protein